MKRQPISEDSIKEIILEKVRFCAAQAINQNVADSLSASTYYDHIIDAIALQLKGWVLAEKLEDHIRTVRLVAEFRYPATWWQMFKEQHFPSWLRDRFPVRYKTERQEKARKVSFKKYATYPHTTLQVPSLGDPVMKAQVSDWDES